MDSKTDVPIILTEDFANKCAKAIVDVIVERGKLEKKPVEDKKLYHVQVGAYSKKENAENMAKKLKAAGFDTYIVQY
jgi:N-acetylmuramoyl-L-alanine amidase